MKDPTYTPDNFLRVAVERASREMMEASGAIRAYLVADPKMVESEFAEIEKAAQYAWRACQNYRRAIASGKGRMTRAEFEGIPDKAETGEATP